MLKTPRARHVRTFSAVPPSPRPPQGPTGRGDKEANGGIDPEEDAEGWDELDLPDESRADHQEEAHGPADSDLPPPPSLAAFLATPLPLTALSLASLAALPELCLLCSLHPHQLWPHRVQILEAIPLWCDPQAYTDLLPEVQVEVDAEVEAQERENGLVAGCERQRWAEAQPWRTSPDWSEQGSFAPRPPAAIATATATAGPARTATAVRAWYLDRIAAHVEAGFVDEALSLIQHGAARNVAGLEETGEDVSLLARLVYDRPEPPSDPSLEQEQTEWTLERWQSLTPREAVEAYTATSTPENLAQTIKRLVLPYLYVVQARAERRRTDTASSLPGTASTGGGEAEALTPTDYLYDYILSLPTRTATPPPTRPSGLDLFLAVVEASIPTLPRQQRLVSSDADLARLAIAALYGAGKAGASSEAAVIMGRVFECLPAFDSPDPSKDMESAQARVDLFALATQSRVSIPTPAAIFSALAGASTSDLSAHLDSLDLHLSQLETFLRYSSPPASSGLAWFLTSYRDRSAQAQWATRLARTASSGGGGRAGAEGAFESEDEWVGLMEFMGDATGVAQPSEGELEREEAVRRGLGRAFHLLNREEVLRIFFGGLLAAGRFELARSMFDPSPSSSFSADTPAPPLEPPVVEDLVISASREFYDNAESGNQHSDEMKMALQCLSAAPQQTPAIRRERDFIEATSRLCSYRLDSRPGIRLTPIELRHAPDRLVFIARLLSANPQVAKHPDMVIDLARKLCAASWSDAHEVRVLVMLSEASTDAGDWNLACETCDRIARAVETLRKRAERGGAEGQASRDVEAVADEAWRACFQLGKHEGWTSDSRRKLEVLGQALTFCPPERIQDILPYWSKLELRVARETLLREKELAQSTGRGKVPPGAAHGAEAAARAAANAAAEATAAGAARVAGFLAAAAARGAGASSREGSTASSVAATPTSAKSFGGMQAPHVASPTTTNAHTGAGASHLAHETAAAASHTFRRAAAFLGGAGSTNRLGSPSPSRASPLSPASASSLASSAAATPARSPPAGAPAVKLAPAPPPRSAGSRFASAFQGVADARGQSPTPASPSRASASSPSARPPAAGGSGFGLRAGLSNTLTAGVGWLIGADEVLEEERRQRAEAEEAEQRRRRREAEAKGAEAPLTPTSPATPPPRAGTTLSPGGTPPPRPGSASSQNRVAGRSKLGAKPVGKAKLAATKVPPATVATKAAEDDDWDAW